MILLQSVEPKTSHCQQRKVDSPNEYFNNVKTSCNQKKKISKDLSTPTIMVSEKKDYLDVVKKALGEV